MEPNSTEPENQNETLNKLLTAARAVVSQHAGWYKPGCRCHLCELKECVDAYATKTV